MKTIRSNKKGFRIHSPFVYALVTNVMFPSADLHVFKEIDALKIKSKRKNNIKLMFRLLNHFQPETILYCGVPINYELEIFRKSVSDVNLKVLNSKNDLILKTAPFVIIDENIFKNEMIFSEIKSIWFINKDDNSIDYLTFFQTLLMKKINYVLIELKNAAVVIFNTKIPTQNYVIK